MALPEPSNLHVLKLHPDAILPSRATPNDAGLDLPAFESIVLPPGETVKVTTALAIKIPEGYVGRICPRSSLAIKGLDVFAGVIDAGFTGEVCIVLFNSSKERVIIERGNKVAQLIVSPIITPTVFQVNKLWDSERGSKGWGDSGV